MLGALLLARRFMLRLALPLHLLHLLHLPRALRLPRALQLLRVLRLLRQLAWTLFVLDTLPLPLRQRGRNRRDELQQRLCVRLRSAVCIGMAPRLRQHRL
jgi:hypothetical protein